VASSGYTPGGVALGTKTHTVYGPLHTSSTPWTQVWAATTGYAVGQVVKPTTGNENGYLFRCVNAATSGGSEPTWNTVVGDPVVDGGSTGSPQWVNCGESVTVWSSAAAAWTGVTFTASFGVIYDAQSGTYASEPLIAVVQFSAPLTPVSGPVTVTPDPNMGWMYWTPA
jgi:hypothetical protein